ncbi:MAG: TolC family protein, partial [Proteobacteria bacterium]|nr:TolC family protein [Pseudomonadota bacterium]
RIVFLLLPLTLTFAVNAQTDSGVLAPETGIRPITLGETIEQALRHNFDVRIERYNPWLATYDFRIARGGYDPLFSASGEHSYSKSFTSLLTNSTSYSDQFRAGLTGSLPWGMTYGLQSALMDNDGRRIAGTSTPFQNSSGSEAYVSLTQPLLKNFWTDSTRLSISVAKNRIKFSEQALQLQLMSTVTDVEKAYYDLIFAQENVKVQEKALQLAEQLFTENKKRVEVGVLAPLDEKQAESQVAARRADLLTARQALNTQQNVLKNLITDDYAKLHDATLQSSEPLTAIAQTFSLQNSWNKGLTQRPDLLRAKLDLERAGIQLKYYKNQVFPQLDLFGTYGQAGSKSEFSGALDDMRDRNQPFYSYGIQLSIPLGNVAARNRYKQGKVTVQQALLTIKKLEQDVMVQIDDAIKNAQVTFERVDATHQASLYAAAALDAERKKLENGKSTSFVVLQLQRDLTAASSDEIRALADYNKALAQVAFVEATTLQRRKIDVTVK